MNFLIHLFQNDMAGAAMEVYEGSLPLTPLAIPLDERCLVGSADAALCPGRVAAAVTASLHAPSGSSCGGKLFTAL